jgi:hypothetical protein
MVASRWFWQPWLGIWFMNCFLHVGCQKVGIWSLGVGNMDINICKISREKSTRTLRICSLKSKGLNVSCGREIWKCKWNVVIHFVISKNVWILGNLNVWCVCWGLWNPKNVHKILEGCDPKQQLDVVMFMWLICHNPRLRLVTKARACEGAGQVWKPRVTFHAPRSVGKWGNEPSHSQVNSHFGSWSPDGVSNF